MFNISRNNKILFLPIKQECKISLRKLSINDQAAVRKWLADPYLTQLTFVVPGPEYSTATTWNDTAIEQYIRALVTDLNRQTFAIELNGNHVGNVGLKELNFEKRSTEFFIEIGESRHRGQGVGKAALVILLEYVFFTLGLNEIRLEVLEFNSIALKVYQDLGFTITHRSGWHYDREGHYWQVWAMSLPKEKWFFRRRQVNLPDHFTLLPIDKP